VRIIRYLASTSFDFGCTSFDYVAVASLLRLGGRLLPGSFVKAVELFLELCERCDLALHLFGPPGDRLRDVPAGSLAPLVQLEFRIPSPVK